MASKTEEATRDEAPARDGDIEALRADIARLSETVKRIAGDRFEDGVSAFQATASTKINEIEAAVRRNPAQATLIAAGIGFLVGLIIRR